MKKLTIGEFVARANELLEASQNERVIVTRRGRPFVMLVGLRNKDAEDLETEFNRAFWHTIAQRRKRTKTIPLTEVMQRIEQRAANEAATSTGRRTIKNRHRRSQPAAA